jgi:hypothetical protein
MLWDYLWTSWGYLKQKIVYLLYAVCARWLCVSHWLRRTDEDTHRYIMIYI